MDERRVCVGQRRCDGDAGNGGTSVGCVSIGVSSSGNVVACRVGSRKLLDEARTRVAICYGRQSQKNRGRTRWYKKGYTNARAMGSGVDIAIDGWGACARVLPER